MEPTQTSSKGFGPLTWSIRSLKNRIDHPWRWIEPYRSWHSFKNRSYLHRSIKNSSSVNGVVYVWVQKSFKGSYAWMLWSLACRCLCLCVCLTIPAVYANLFFPHWTEWKIESAANYHKNDDSGPFEASKWLGIFDCHPKTLFRGFPWNPLELIRDWYWAFKFQVTVKITNCEWKTNS